ncbi:MAG: FAD-dependent oxidoreductase [Solirubrobacterales bacterium]
MDREPAHIAIVGGSIAALEAAIGLSDSFVMRATVTVITSSTEFVYTPFAVLEPFGLGKASKFDLRETLANPRVSIVEDVASRVDVDRRVVCTAAGREVAFDAAVVATGAQRHAVLDNAITIGGPGGIERMGFLVAEIDAGTVGTVVFAIPPGITWTLPLYELAMLTAARAKSRLRDSVRVVLVTAEDEPLAIFGHQASRRIRELLDERDVELATSTHAVNYDGESLELAMRENIAADRVVAMPRLFGQPIPGLPHDRDGFLQTDAFGLIDGLKDVYAAGDVTAFPVKQGGIAAQQADAVVSALEARFGGREEAEPFHPDLRGILVTENEELFMHAQFAAGGRDTAELSNDPLWNPGDKIYSKHLSRRLNWLTAAKEAAS